NAWTFIIENADDVESPGIRSVLTRRGDQRDPVTDLQTVASGAGCPDEPAGAVGLERRDLRLVDDILGKDPEEAVDVYRGNRDSLVRPLKLTGELRQGTHL